MVFLQDQIDLGLVSKGNLYTASGMLANNAIIEYSFSIDEQDGVFGEFSLYNLNDDLDMTLYQFDSNEYLRIAASEDSGLEDEYIGKYMLEGDYILEISYYEQVAGDSQSGFDFSIDTNSFYENTIIPNDEFFRNQWFVFNTGQAGGLNNEDILAPEAWKIRSTSPDVIVAVIDGGVDINHPDLSGNIWRNELEIPGNDNDDDNNGYKDDVNGWNFSDNNNLPLPDIHGTHVAGTIGAAGNNNVGVAGVTWDVQLMSLDVFGAYEKASDETILEAIYYAVDNGAKVINMSLGQDFQLSYQEFAALLPSSDALYKAAFEYAIEKGVTVVIAAGNSSNNFDQNWISAPAVYSNLYEGVISVAAVANTGDLAEYSNYGSKVTIAAPGGDSD